jgi:diaminohydroxyphosphoribosylaminopyrimidine deaminase/5-amino-6-(5-phosphoribosylamino)uracil reductase
MPKPKKLSYRTHHVSKPESEPDLDPMAWALNQARQALMVSAPNPRVGCVLVDATGQLIGQGHTQAVGGAHAEVMALQDAHQRGHRLEGATAYVTLEPCCHQGRTPPCTQALINAQIARVVYALKDPNPQVNAQGLAQLQAHGIAVEPAAPGQAWASLQLNRAFFSRFVRGKPWVRLKMAVSHDGRTALVDGQPYAVTGPVAQQDGHAYRAQACVLLTGVGTILADDPLLNARCPDAPGCHQPALAILDSQLRTPLHARALREALCAKRPVVIYTHQPDWARREALEAQGVAVYEVGWDFENSGLDWPEIAADLLRRGWHEVHVEAGARLGHFLLGKQYVDELLLYRSSLILGQGPVFWDKKTQTQTLEKWAQLSHTYLGKDERWVLLAPAAQAWLRIVQEQFAGKSSASFSRAM